MTELGESLVWAQLFDGHLIDSTALRKHCLEGAAEVAFYDAIVQSDSAVLELGDETLKEIASRLVEAVRESATIDWNLKEGVRAAMRAKVKRLLTQYDYPPDKEEKAIELVLEQAELFAGEEAA